MHLRGHYLTLQLKWVKNNIMLLSHVSYIIISILYTSPQMFCSYNICIYFLYKYFIIMHAHYIYIILLYLEDCKQKILCSCTHKFRNTYLLHRDFGMNIF